MPITTVYCNFLVIMSRGFWECSSNLVTIISVASYVEVKDIGTCLQRNVIVFLSQQEACSVEGHFKLGRGANERSTDHFGEAMPVELQRQNLIVCICCSFIVSAWFDVATVVNVASLFLQIIANPVV